LCELIFCLYYAEIGRKGDLASGESKRNSKRLKQYVEIILDMDIKDEQIRKGAY